MWALCGTPIPQLTNAGNVKIAGFEAELAFSPADFFEVLLGLGYLETETKNFISFTGLDSNDQPLFEDFSGSELTLSPKLSYNGVFRFHQPLLGGEGSLQVDFTHSDEYYFRFGQHAVQRRWGLYHLERPRSLAIKRRPLRSCRVRQEPD